MPFTVTEGVAWAIFGSLSLILAGRLLLVRETVIDYLANRLLLWSLLALLLYRWSKAGPFAGVVEQFASGCVVLSTTYLLGIARLEGVDEDMGRVRQRERRYCAIALAFTAAILFAGWSADAEGLPLDIGIGWQGFLLVLSTSVPITVNTVLFAIRGIRELRTGSREAVEKLVAFALFAVNLFVWTNQLLSASQILFGRPDMGPYLPRVEWIFTVCIAANGALLALPLAAALGEVAGLDSAGRSRRRLHVLWRDLTEAVPEIVMSPGSDSGSHGRLFRMTVEIRDAILHLGPTCRRPTTVVTACAEIRVNSIDSRTGSRWPPRRARRALSLETQGAQKYSSYRRTTSTPICGSWVSCLEPGCGCVPLECPPTKAPGRPCPPLLGQARPG
ncbi:DUF6545 domain-containing protein [Nocardia xishanensis]